MEQLPVDTPRVASVAEVAKVAGLLDAFNREYDTTTPGKAVLSHCSTLPRAAPSWSTNVPPHRRAQATLGWMWTPRSVVAEGGHHQACIVGGKRYGGGMYCIMQQIPSRHDLRQLVGRASR